MKTCQRPPWREDIVAPQENEWERMPVAGREDGDRTGAWPRPTAPRNQCKPDGLIRATPCELKQQCDLSRDCTGMMSFRRISHPHTALRENDFPIRACPAEVFHAASRGR